MLSVFAGGSAEWSIYAGEEFDYYKSNINKRVLCWRREWIYSISTYYVLNFLYSPITTKYSPIHETYFEI